MMASFHGKKSRASGFVSPPVSHKIIELPLNDFGHVKSIGKTLEGMVHHASKTRRFRRHVKTLKIKEPPPPLPRERYQISRLKWIPTDDTTATKETKFQIGYFQGAYCVPGTTYFSLVSLRDEWVDFQFEQGFV